MVFVGKLNWIETNGLNWTKIGNFRFGFNWINLWNVKKKRNFYDFKCMISKGYDFQSVMISSVLVSKEL